MKMPLQAQAANTWSLDVGALGGYYGIFRHYNLAGGRKLLRVHSLVLFPV